MKRRKYIALVASTGATVDAFDDRVWSDGGRGRDDSGSGDEENGGPRSESTRRNQVDTLPDVEGGWDLVFEDAFDTGVLDTTTWDLGWGWGRETSMSPTVIVPENVSVDNGALRLMGTHDDDGTYAGAVNTRNRLTFGPGCYFEASITFAHRTGFQNAFWAKPNTELWPPEIDVVEVWQENDEPDDPYTSYHTLHYTESTVPGHEMVHQRRAGEHESDDDVSQHSHTYGVEWQPERIVHYVDGWPIIRWTDPLVLAGMGAGAPFYMMFSLNIDNIGTADRSEPWGEEMVVDWVRLWDYVPPTDEDGERRYLWFRSVEEGELAAFTFRTSGGNVLLDAVENDPGYWVTEDRTGGGGSVSSRESLPGFLYNGDITAFRHSGPLEVFIDDTRVDPSSLVDRTSQG